MSEAVRAGYKQTEVGVIPEDWEVRRLIEVVDFLDGLRRPVKDTDRGKMRGDIPYYGASGIVDYVNDYLFDDELILLGEDGENILSRNCRLAFRVSGKIWVNNHAHVLKPKNGNQIGYLVEFLESLNYEQYNTGTAQPKLNKQVCSGLQVVVPPIPEQRAIATALSDVDALLAKLDALIAKKRDLKVAAMQQLLTGQTRLPGFSGEWEVKRLGDVLSRMANGAVYKPTNSRGIQITRIETIADGTIDYSRTGVAEDSPELERYKIISGDILFSHINSVDHIGKVAIFNDEQPLYHGMNLLLLRTNKDADSNFLYFWFTSLPARRQTRNLAKQAVSQASINTKELKALEIRLPPMPEQIAIATVLSDMDAELTALEARRDKTRALKQGMMQELLTGRIRLIARGLNAN